MRQTGGSHTGYHPFLLDICCANGLAGAFRGLGFRKWGTVLWVVSGSLICQESAGPCCFLSEYYKNSGVAHASVLAECDAVLHRISMPAMFSRKGPLLQRFLNSGIAGVPQVECSLSRDEFALGHRLNLKRSKKGLIIYLVCLGKRFLLDSLS